MNLPPEIQNADEPPEMPCREFVDALTEYLEGALPPVDALRLEVHLAVCAKCAVYLDQMRQTLLTVGRVDVDALGAPARDELMSAFRRWSAEQP